MNLHIVSQKGVCTIYVMSNDYDEAGIVERILIANDSRYVEVEKFAANPIGFTVFNPTYNLIYELTNYFDMEVI